MDSNSTYRLGYTDIYDTMAIYYHLFISNARKELGLPCRLEIGRYANIEDDIKILEIGPSSGVVTAASFCSLNKNLTLFDKWGYYKQWSVLKKYNPNIRFVLGDADSPFPFKDASFDVCVFMGAICYMHHPTNTLLEVNRVLRSGGKLFISSSRKKVNSINAEIGRFDDTIPTYWNGEELSTALQGTGFRTIKMHDYGLYPKWFCDIYRRYNKFIYFHGGFYDQLVSMYPDRYVFAGAVAVKD